VSAQNHHNLNHALKKKRKREGLTGDAVAETWVAVRTALEGNRQRVKGASLDLA
jgi:hypothetical protein